MDGKWRVETPSNVLVRVGELYDQFPKTLGTHIDSDGRLLWRRIKPGEKLWDRDPQRDGVTVLQRDPTAGPKYPWKLWMNGDFHLAVKGVDFDCTTDSFISYLRKQASRRRIGVVAKGLPGGSGSIYSKENDVVAFRFGRIGQPVDWNEGRQALKHLERDWQGLGTAKG